MVNINLSSGGAQPQQEDKIKWGWALPLEIIIILLIIGGWIFLYLDIKRLDKEIESTKSNNDAQAKILRGESARSVFDFQIRMNEAEKILADNPNSLEIMRELENTIIPEAYLDSLSYDSAKKEIALVYFARSFDQVARQISALKKSSFFVSTSAGETEITDKGLVKFSAIVKVK